MHNLKELDLLRQRREGFRREVDEIRLARRLRSAGAGRTPRPSPFARVWDALREAPGGGGVEDCKG